MTVRSNVNELTPDMTGRWIVKTQGSEHVFDLDLHIYERHQLDGLDPMRHDREPLVLTPRQVLRWPMVGNTFIILVHDADDPAVSTMRTSSIVTSITRSE